MLTVVHGNDVRSVQQGGQRRLFKRGEGGSVPGTMDHQYRVEGTVVSAKTFSIPTSRSERWIKGCQGLRLKAPKGRFQ